MARSARPDLLQLLHDPTAGHGLLQPPQDFQVAQSGEVIVKRRLFDHGPYLRQGLVSGLFERCPEDLHVPFRREDEMQNHPDGGAFACAVGTEKAKDIAPPDLDVQMVHGQSVFVALRQLNGAQDGVGHLPSAFQRHGDTLILLVDHAPIKLPHLGEHDLLFFPTEVFH